MIPSELASSKQSAFSGLGPITLDPVLVERIWGVDSLAPWYESALGGGPVGEAWLTAEACKAISGSWAGATLGELTSAAPEALGDPAHQGFPLLIKLLFPREKLSVQVHPDDAQAQAGGMPRGKTECWYVLSAESGAQVAVGFKEPLSQAEVKSAIEDGSLEGKLRTLPVKAGDMVFVDAGTVHAIGPGMVVLETQQYSDTTYRLWDYGRPRELHIDAGTAVTRTATAAGLVTQAEMDGFTRLLSCDYFAVDRFRLQGGGETDLGNPGKLQILIALEGSPVVRSNGGNETVLPKAKAVVLPASDARYALTAGADAEVIRVLQP